MSILSLFPALILTASAVVRPTGTIVENKCGHLNRTVQICDARTEGIKNWYLVIRRNGQVKYYVKAQHKPAEEAYTLTGHIVDLDDKDLQFMVEKEVKLEVMLDIQSRKTSGKYSINGKSQGGSFEMEQIVHPETE